MLSSEAVDFQGRSKGAVKIVGSLRFRALLSKTQGALADTSHLQKSNNNGLDFKLKF